MMLTQLKGLVAKPENVRRQTALAEALRKALDVKDSPVKLPEPMEARS